jgi:fucose 4-O-acetylase-like acetyltransferase
VRIGAVAVLAAALAVAYAAAGHGLTEFFFSRSDRGAFDELSFARWSVLRVLALVCAVAATAAFLALVPRRRTRLTALGEGTMCAYLLHGFVVKGAGFAGVYDQLHSPAGFAVVTLAAAALALVLCSRPVGRAFRWVVEPELRWAFRDHDTRALPELALDSPDRQHPLLGSPASL